MKRVQILGLCRFSYLGGRGFQVEHDSLEARRAFLYDPARLARRWAWFESVTLPALRRQTDPDWTLVLMTGPDLPQPWLDRLRALTCEVPQLRLSLVRPMAYHLAACWHAVRPHVEASAEVVGHFRLDDDDAVAVDFAVRARRDFRRVQPLFRHAGRVAIDYQSGLVLRAGASGLEMQPRIIHQASAALVVYLPPAEEATAVHIPHWQASVHMPVVALADSPMFCRSVTGDNDSGDVGPGHALPEAGDTVEILRARFAIDPQRFGNALASPPRHQPGAAQASRPAS